MFKIIAEIFWKFFKEDLQTKEIPYLLKELNCILNDCEFESDFKKLKS